jgi:hypothetical protein
VLTTHRAKQAFQKIHCGTEEHLRGVGFRSGLPQSGKPHASAEATETAAPKTAEAATSASDAIVADAWL